MRDQNTKSQPFRRTVVYKPDFLDRFYWLVAFDAETTGKRTPDADFIRKQPFAWKPPGIIIEIGFVEMLRDGGGWRKGETWRSLVNPDGPMDPASHQDPQDPPGRPQGRAAVPDDPVEGAGLYWGFADRRPRL